MEKTARTAADSATPSESNDAPCRHLNYPQKAVQMVDEARTLSGSDPRAFELFQRAAALDHPYAQYRLGLIFYYERADHLQAWKCFALAQETYYDAKRHLALLLEKGLLPLEGASTNPEIAARQNQEAVARLYLEAAEAGSYIAAYCHAQMLLEGRGVTRNYRRAVKWLTFSACWGYFKAQARLAQLCLDKSKAGYDLVSAYIWAVMSSCEEADDLIEKLEAKLTEEQISACQSEADRRSAIIKQNKMLTPADLEGGAGVFCDSLPLKPLCQEVLIGSSPQTACESQPAPAPTDDPEPSPGVVYRHCAQISRAFEPSLLRLSLILPRRLTPRDEMDFSQLKISYNRADSDIKRVEDFLPYKVYKAERKLLLRLAAQNSLPDADRRAKNIRRILTENRAEFQISRLNTLFRAIFPGCLAAPTDRLISRRDAQIKVCLSVDTSLLTNARDYSLCLL